MGVCDKNHVVHECFTILLLYIAMVLINLLILKLFTIRVSDERQTQARGYHPMYCDVDIGV